MLYEIEFYSVAAVNLKKSTISQQFCESMRVSKEYTIKGSFPQCQLQPNQNSKPSLNIPDYLLLFLHHYYLLLYIITRSHSRNELIKKLFWKNENLGQIIISKYVVLSDSFTLQVNMIDTTFLYQISFPILHYSHSSYYISPTSKHPHTFGRFTIDLSITVSLVILLDKNNHQFTSFLLFLRLLITPIKNKFFLIQVWDDLTKLHNIVIPPEIFHSNNLHSALYLLVLSIISNQHSMKINNKMPRLLSRKQVPQRNDKCV